MQPVPDNRKKFDIKVQSPNGIIRKFRTVRLISSYGAEPFRGRGTRVFEAVELDQNGEELGSNVVLKDMWIDSDRKREGDILASIYGEAVGDERNVVQDRFLTTVCHGDVWIDPNTRDDTAGAVMHGLEIGQGHGSSFDLKSMRSSGNRKQASGSGRLRATARAQTKKKGSGRKYEHKTHYRIVFKEICETIDTMRSLPDVMVVLAQTVTCKTSFYFCWVKEKLG